jgi:1,4-dihydroxy-2-naphthoate polyprenyltransferase
MKAWFRALRAHFLTASVAPVLVGTAAAWFEARVFDPLLFALALVGAVLVHLGANMANDYFDSRSETDAKNASGSAYSGGSRVIQDGLIPARQILAAALICIAAGSLIGLYLVWHLRSLTLLILGAAGVFLAYFYTGTPLRLGYRGLAELCNGIAFGPVIALGAAVVQTGSLTLTTAAASIPPGVLLATVLMINEFPDHDSDKAVGKRTMVVILGRYRALGVYLASMFFSFAWVIAFSAARVFPWWSLASLASIPLALRAAVIARRHVGDSRRIVGANMATFLLHICFCLLLAASFLAGAA